MTLTINKLLDELKHPEQEINRIREGVPTYTIDEFLDKESLSKEDILLRLAIPKSTYYAKKDKPLDPHITEKFLRLIHIVMLATEILGKPQAKSWLYQKIPSLGNQIPLDLLDTEAGHKIVEQALLQIKYGVYG